MKKFPRLHGRGLVGRPAHNEYWPTVARTWGPAHNDFLSPLPSDFITPCSIFKTRN